MDRAGTSPRDYGAWGLVITVVYEDDLGAAVEDVSEPLKQRLDVALLIAGRDDQA